MVKPRIPETDEGITGECTTQAYDVMMRRLRDRGWMETGDIIKSGISSGMALELGPGPGYLGLEWLKRTEGTSLKGLDISDDMIAIARRNAVEYGLAERVEYVKGDAARIPFEPGYFDAVFSNGSLHEWARPKETLNEMHRVLKPRGRYHVSDLRRDMSPVIKWFLWVGIGPREMRSGLLSSINAAYTPGEIKELLTSTKLAEPAVAGNFIGLAISGQTP